MADERKKVVVLLGSPRKNGNSTVLAERIAAGAQSSGAEVESIYINALNIKPCQGCWKCQNPDAKGCVIQDDMQQVLPKLASADAWVIATPVHWFNMSTQTKLWMDRCFALSRYGNNPYRKKIGIAITYGDTDPFSSGAVNAIRCFQDSFKYSGATIAGIIYGSATKPGEISNNAQVLAAAEELGKRLVG